MMTTQLRVVLTISSHIHTLILTPLEQTESTKPDISDKDPLTDIEQDCSLEAVSSRDSSNQTHSACELPLNQVMPMNQQVEASVPVDQETKDDLDTEDDDVREAKANIKEHLDRMKETELFLKSMQQEEENMERQRQQMFLFNNLMLSTKLNGIHKASQHLTMANDEPTMDSNCHHAGIRSAPIRGCYHNGIPDVASEVLSDHKTNGFVQPSPALSFEPTYTISPIGANYLAQRRLNQSTPLEPLDLSQSCMRATDDVDQTNVYRPPLYRDPLEPVQPVICQSSAMPSYANAFEPPLGLNHYHPSLADRGRRSRSQLSDQFNDYKRTRPVSACIDPSDSNPYFPSQARSKRSLSQLRSGATSSPLNTNRYSIGNGQSLSAMYNTEYRNAYGRSGLQAMTTTANGSRALESPTEIDIGDTIKRNHDTDDSDDGMSAYRASTYVPKVVPQGMPTRGRSFQRRSLAFDTPISGGTTTKGWRTSLLSKGNKDDNKYTSAPDRPSYERPTESSTSKRRERRISLDNYGQNRTEKLMSAEDESSSVTSRRRGSLNSLTQQSDDMSSKKLSTASGARFGSNSRLMELEQRIQENKKRREELLTGGKLSPQNSHHNTPQAEQTMSSSLSTSTRDQVINAPQNLSERTIRDVTPVRIGKELDQLATSEPSTSPRLSTKFSRPSRLESMEARIKRKSYCVRMDSPERAQLRSSQLSSERWTGGKRGSAMDPLPKGSSLSGLERTGDGGFRSSRRDSGPQRDLD